MQLIGKLIVNVIGLQRQDWALVMEHLHGGLRHGLVLENSELNVRKILVKGRLQNILVHTQQFRMKI